MKINLTFALLVILSLLPGSHLSAGIFSGLNPDLTGGNRWDAAVRTTADGERSLNGGLRYSMQGGSYAAFRDLIKWHGTAPTTTQFQGAVERAFGTWTQVDPTSGFGTSLSFQADFGTAVQGTVGGGINTAGAEIDIFASDDGIFWNPGDVALQGEVAIGASGSSVTLTSGTTNYTASAIDGADLRLNSNGVYTLDIFQIVLAHELGHTLGLGDVESGATSGLFVDDNYDGTNATTALDTLTNSWADKVNALDPSQSALNTYKVPTGNPGLGTPNVDILMESNIPVVLLPNSDIIPLSNDDFGSRQFLYPELSAVPEPGTFAALGLASCIILFVSLRRRKKKTRARS